MELVALVLAIFRRPLFILIGVVLSIGFAQDNPWTAMALLALLIAVAVALVWCAKMGRAD